MKSLKVPDEREDYALLCLPRSFTSPSFPNVMSLRRRNKPQAEPPDSDAGEDDSRRRSSSSGTGDVNSSSSGDEGQGISVLDILRVLATLVALWLSLSYYLTSGDSLTFNYRPWFTRANRLKAYIVCSRPLRKVPFVPTNNVHQLFLCKGNKREKS